MGVGIGCAHTELLRCVAKKAQVTPRVNSACVYAGIYQCPDREINRVALGDAGEIQAQAAGKAHPVVRQQNNIAPIAVRRNFMSGFVHG